MHLDEALEVVKERYGLLDAYVEASGMIMYVVAAEQQLRAIPEVNNPTVGIALSSHEVIELGRGAITVRELVRRKNPELFRLEL